MSFIKRDVKDRVVQYPRRYQLVEVQPGIFDLVPVTGTVTEEGTPINKAYLQPIEDGINDLDTEVDAHLADDANPHNTNKLDVGLSNVDNFKQATKVEFDEHLAEKATQDKLGHIKLGKNVTIDEEGKMDSNDGSWEKVTSLIVDAEVMQVEFTNIPEDYRCLKLIFNIPSASTRPNTPKIRLNGDTGNNYTYQLTKFTGSTISTVGLQSNSIELPYGQPFQNAPSSFGEIMILVEPLIEKTLLVKYTTSISATDIQSVLITACWKNKINGVNKITFDGSSLNFTKGSQFVLWGSR